MREGESKRGRGGVRGGGGGGGEKEGAREREEWKVASSLPFLATP